MLGEAPAGANIPVKDVEEARRFYEGVIGATEVWSNEGNVVYRSGGTHWAIYESAGAGRAEHTLLTFLVSDVGEMVRELRLQGVSLEEYDLPGLKTKDGIANIAGNQIAWFKDPDGNIISIEKASWHSLLRPHS